MTPEKRVEFQMFVPEDDGSAMDWLENTLTKDRAALHTSLVVLVAVAFPGWIIIRAMFNF